jgi:hypothetical protein
MPADRQRAVIKTNIFSHTLISDKLYCQHLPEGIALEAANQ